MESSHITPAGWKLSHVESCADLPEGEKNPSDVKSLLGAIDARQHYGDGVFGGKYQVDDEIMGEIFEAVVADVIQLLCDLISD